MVSKSLSFQLGSLSGFRFTFRFGPTRKVIKPWDCEALVQGRSDHPIGKVGSCRNGNRGVSVSCSPGSDRAPNGRSATLLSRWTVQKWETGEHRQLSAQQWQDPQPEPEKERKPRKDCVPACGTGLGQGRVRKNERKGNEQTGNEQTNQSKGERSRNTLPPEPPSLEQRPHPPTQHTQPQNNNTFPHIRDPPLTENERKHKRRE